MLEQYLIIHKSILPDYYEKVVEVRRLLESGKIKDISQAVKQVGISRSTYYKYKDFIMEPADLGGARKAVISMMLTHEQGMLSSTLSCISDAGGSVLTISQSMPIHAVASVTICLDVSTLKCGINELLDSIARSGGAEQVRLLGLD